MFAIVDQQQVFNSFEFENKIYFYNTDNTSTELFSEITIDNFYIIGFVNNNFIYMKKNKSGTKIILYYLDINDNFRTFDEFKIILPFSNHMLFVNESIYFFDLQTMIIKEFDLENKIFIHDMNIKNLLNINNIYSSNISVKNISNYGKYLAFVCYTTYILVIINKNTNDLFIDDEVYIFNDVEFSENEKFAIYKPLYKDFLRIVDLETFTIINQDIEVFTNQEDLIYEYKFTNNMYNDICVFLYDTIVGELNTTIKIYREYNLIYENKIDFCINIEISEEYFAVIYHKKIELRDINNFNNILIEFLYDNSLTKDCIYFKKMQNFLLK